VNHSILNKIVNWAENESEIRTLILEGSRASNSPTDELSSKIGTDTYLSTYIGYRSSQK
jgi:hypothetical protein